MFSIAFPQTERSTVALCDFIFITGCHGKCVACYLRMYLKAINTFYFRNFLL